MMYEDPNIPIKQHGNKGKKQSAETKAKRSASLKGIPKTAAHRAAMSKAGKARQFTDAHKAAISAGVIQAAIQRRARDADK